MMAVNEIREKLRDSGIKQYRIAQKVGLSEWRMSMILNGRRKMTEAEREKLQEFLNGMQ